MVAKKTGTLEQHFREISVFVLGECKIMAVEEQAAYSTKQDQSTFDQILYAIDCYKRTLEDRRTSPQLSANTSAPKCEVR